MQGEHLQLRLIFCLLRGNSWSRSPAPSLRGILAPLKGSRYAVVVVMAVAGVKMERGGQVKRWIDGTGLCYRTKTFTPLTELHVHPNFLRCRSEASYRYVSSLGGRGWPQPDLVTCW